MTWGIIGAAVEKTAPTAGRRSWVEVCAEHAEQNHLPPETLEVLAAFAGTTSEIAGGFSALHERVRRRAPSLAGAIVAALNGEVDAAQASMFARRLASVDTLLSTLTVPEAAVLRVGLVQRMDEVLTGRRPLALRVRALTDFYYSQAALLHHSTADQPSLSERAAGLTWRRVANGVDHSCITGLTDQGPVFANVLRVAGGRIAAADCRGAGGLAALLERTGAVAGISGGFFLYSEPDIALPSRRTDPVGLLVSKGCVENPPIFARSALTWNGREVGIEELSMVGVELQQGARSIPIVASNAPAAMARGAVSFSRAWGEVSPDAPWSVAVVGRQITAVGPGPMPVPLAGAVLALPVPVAVTTGPISWQLPVGLQEAMAGGPRLLREGRIELDLVRQDFAGSAPPLTFSQDETFDQNRLPRMAAGLDASGVLFLVAIDGRNIERALGSTLRQTAALCRALGCVDAMNLDGGSSKRMIVEGEVVDLSTTEVIASGASARVRPVHSAIVVFAS